MTELKEIHSKALIEELEKKATEHNQKLVELETSLKQKHSTEIENLKNEHDFFVNVIKDVLSIVIADVAIAVVVVWVASEL